MDEYFCLQVCVCVVCKHVQKPEPETSIKDGWELPHQCWELGPGPLEEQQVLLKLSHVLSPLQWNYFFKV